MDQVAVENQHLYKMRSRNVSQDRPPLLILLSHRKVPLVGALLTGWIKIVPY